MRVLVVPKWFPWPELPVFGWFCREQADALATRHDVVVLASLFTPSPDFRCFRLTDQVEDGLRVLRVRYRRPRLRPFALVFQLMGMLAALRRLRGEGWRPDIVHAHVYSAALPALVLARLSCAPMAVTEHYTGFPRGQVTGYDKLLARVAFQRADVVATVSDYLGRHVRAVAPRARLMTVPNVVDTATFTPPGEARPPTPAPLLLGVGALAEKKGNAHLLEALALLPNARLELIGDGELRAALERRARELGVHDRVDFRGEQPNHVVAERMRAADLFVLPSLFETFGVVLIEAAASGLPSVATRVGGVPEALVPGSGLLVEPADPGALAEGIEQALSTHFDGAAMAATVHDRFGVDAFAERWTQIYTELLRSRGSTCSATSRAVAPSE